MLNKVILIGYLSQNPVVKETQKSKVCNFSLTTSETNPQSGKVFKQFHKCVGWGKLADEAGKMQEGDLLYLEGKLSHRSYEKDGAKTWVTEVNINAINKLSGASQELPEEQPQSNPADDEIPF